MSIKSIPLTSEDKILQLLQARYIRRHLSVVKGIGDDAAVIDCRGAQEYWLATSDMLLEGVDFRRGWTTPRQLGCKSLSANLSDLAAMGARPRFYMVCLGLPRSISESWISDFYDGLTEVADSHRALLIGGDLSHTTRDILISVTAVGESLNRKVLYRSGGRPGDSLYVTGVLGRSAAGLKLLQNGCTRPRAGPRREALQVQRTPEARCKVGLWLAQCGLVNCMMDLSDGLSIDLPRLCAASGVGAEITASCLPTFLKSASWGCDPLALALHGGEDYELLFSVPGSKIPLFSKTYPRNYPQVTKIGRFTADAGEICINDSAKGRRPLPQCGYDHFRSSLSRTSVAPRRIKKLQVNKLS